MRETNDMTRVTASGRLTRRTYELPQPTSPVLLREYILTSIDGERACLLRWLLQEDIAVEGLRFDFSQLNENGDEIDTTEVVIEKKELPPMMVGELFAPRCAIPVSPRCVGIRVIMHEIVSGDYRYRVTPTGVVVEYTASTAWIYDERAAKRDKMGKGDTFRAESKLGRRVRGIWPVALLALVVVGVVLSASYLKRVIAWDLVRRAIVKFITDIEFPWEKVDEVATETVGALLRTFRLR